jgi:two-component system sensor histidine kinase DesK
LLSPLALVGTQWYDTGPISGGVYLAFAITWRTATQFLPLRLMAATSALDVATRELEGRAVVNTRMRIDADLRTGVGQALEQIIAQGEAARANALVDSRSATAALQQLVGDARRALADARRVAAGYRTSSERAELEAALALFHALEGPVSSNKTGADAAGDAAV